LGEYTSIGGYQAYLVVGDAYTLLEEHSIVALERLPQHGVHAVDEK